ncbi:MAG: endonuclease/exonuclease/phosphatase family protein [Solobacterium sp.]|nr:endonuclease/exonuclease/phosphatase family protein [Solobacterium sp.]
MKPLRVMSFNIHNSAMSEFLGRRDSISLLVRTAEPDVIGIQEFDDKMIPGLDFLYETYGFTGRARASSKSNERCCIAYRKDRFRLKRSVTLWLSDTPEVPGSRYFLSVFPRIVTIAVLEDIDDHTVFTFANTHLDHLLPMARSRQIRVLSQLLKEYREGEFLVLTGDFNCTAAEASVLSILKDPVLCLRNPAPASPADLLNDLVHAASSRYRPIDLILVSDFLETRDFTSLTGLYAGKYPSDHTPVMVTLVPEEKEDPIPEAAEKTEELPKEEEAEVLFEAEYCDDDADDLSLSAPMAEDAKFLEEEG